MARLIVGAALMPTAVLMVGAAVAAVGGLTAHTQAAWPFLCGISAVVVAWFFGRFLLEGSGGPVGLAASLVRRGYVFGHELTHALAAWSVGAKVLGFKVGDDGGHVDLSHTNAFIALAPYCVPIYTLAVVAAYRLLLYFKPGAGGRLVFLAAMGVTIGFHLIKTCETLLDRKQPDLPAAGGIVFSLAWILFFNGLAILLLVKALFPPAVGLAESARMVTRRTAGFWRALYGVVEPLRRSFAAQMRRP